MMKLVALSPMILRTPHIQKQFVYYRMSLKSELWGRAGNIFPQYESDHCFPVNSSGSSQSQGGEAGGGTDRLLSARVGEFRQKQVIDIVLQESQVRDSGLSGPSGLLNFNVVMLQVDVRRNSLNSFVITKYNSSKSSFENLISSVFPPDFYKVW